MWKANTTNGQGNRINRLNNPKGIFIDNDDHVDLVTGGIPLPLLIHSQEKLKIYKPEDEIDQLDMMATS